MSIDKVNLANALDAVSEHWRPRIIGEVNGSKIQVVKFKGDFVWHRHDDSEDVFLVLHGRMLVDLPDRTGDAEHAGVLTAPEQYL